MTSMPAPAVTGAAGSYQTINISEEAAPPAQSVRLAVILGPDAGRQWTLQQDRLTIGTDPSNGAVLSDRTASRVHCEVQLAPGGAHVRDLGSRNGTFVDGVRIQEARIRNGSILRAGSTAVRVHMAVDLPGAGRPPGPVRFGSLVAVSPAMKAVFNVLERAAASHASVLIEGETGTGKTQVAESIHRGSARRDRPFVTLDCSAVQANLLESELFGHERGAFTGASERRIGVFEAAAGGTLFLDEIGELPLDLQPKLLRVLENRELRRVGSNVAQPVDVRVIAATNRDLRAEVRAGRFRADLYFRLAVVQVAIPPLRDRPDDIPHIAEHLLSSLGARADQIERILGGEGRRRLATAPWPGNVRELRNTLERALVLEEMGEDEDEPAPPASPPVSIQPGPGSGPEKGVPPVSGIRSLSEARQEAVDTFERDYLQQLLDSHGGRVSQAARAAGISRVYLYKLLERHGIKK